MTKKDELTLIEAAVILGVAGASLATAACVLFPDEVKAALSGAFTALGLELGADVVIDKLHQLPRHGA